MGFLGGKSCAASFSITLETGQTDIVMGVASGVIQPVHTELLCVFWGISPEQLGVACCTMVALGLLELQDVIDLEVESHPAIFVLALISHELPLDRLAELLLGELLGLGTLLRGTDYSFELVHVLYSGYSKVS